MSFYTVVVSCVYICVFVFVCLCQFPGADEFPHSGDGQFDQDGCGCQVSSPPAACCALCLSYYNIFSIWLDLFSPFKTILLIVNLSKDSIFLSKGFGWNFQKHKFELQLFLLLGVSAPAPSHLCRAVMKISEIWNHPRTRARLKSRQKRLHLRPKIFTSRLPDLHERAVECNCAAKRREEWERGDPDFWGYFIRFTGW